MCARTPSWSSRLLSSLDFINQTAPQTWSPGDDVRVAEAPFQISDLRSKSRRWSDSRAVEWNTADGFCSWSLADSKLLPNPKYKKLPPTQSSKHIKVCFLIRNTCTLKCCHWQNLYHKASNTSRVLQQKPSAYNLMSRVPGWSAHFGWPLQKYL